MTTTRIAPRPTDLPTRPARGARLRARRVARRLRRRLQESLGGAVALPAPVGIMPGGVELFDLTEPVFSGMPVSKREAPVRVDGRATHEEDGFASSIFSLGSHAGTHLDSPYHFFADGLTIDQLPLSLCFGPGVVLDVRDAGMRITGETIAASAELAGGLAPGFFALIWTGWDRMFGTPAMYEHPYLTVEAATYLLDNGCLLAAIDAIGVDDSAGCDFPAHTLLLSRGVPIVESVRGLEQLGPGVFGCAVVPLKIRGGDAAPARVLAWRMAGDQQNGASMMGVR